MTKGVYLQNRSDSFIVQPLKTKVMLGIRSQCKPICGKYAEEIRAAVLRMVSGKRNRADRERTEYEEKTCRLYDVVWK